MIRKNLGGGTMPLMVMLLGLGAYFFGVDVDSSQLFVTAADDVGGGNVAAKSKGEIAPIKKFGLDHEGLGAINALSRRLRGKQANPAEIIPEVHDAIKAQLHNMQSMHKMYQDGDDAALASSIKNLIDETSSTARSPEGSKELVAMGIQENKDLTLVDTVLDWEYVPDAQIIEHFDPSDLPEHIEQLQEFDNILESVKPILQSPSFQSSPRRRLKGSQFSERGGGSGRHGYPQSFEGLRQKLDKMARSTRAGMRRKLPDLSRFGFEFHGRRLEEKPQVCSVQCQPTDMSCMCQRLSDCVQKMSHYDMTLLFANGYVEEDSTSDDFAELTVSDVDLRLFDIDQNAYSKFVAMNETAAEMDTSNDEQCHTFLEEFHSPCDPLSDESCDDGNKRSFQMTVDQVCDAVNSPTKLYFGAIGDVFDGYASTDGLDTDFTTCGEDRVAFESCRTFIAEFENLYNVRDTSKFPHPNPMRPDPRVSVGDGTEGGILFPTHYTFEQDIHGIPNLALPDISAISTSGKDIRVIGTSMCMDSGYGGDNEGNIYMADCLGNSNQEFYFDRDTFQIKQDTSKDGTLCLDYDSDSNNVYLHSCHAGLNQKWRYNSLTLELNTFYDDKCLDWDNGGANNNNLYMHLCNGNANQHFNIPKTWLGLPEPATSKAVKVLGEDLCMDSGFGGENPGNMYIQTCLGNGNQVFYYDSNTYQIKQDTPDGTQCLDYDPNSMNVYLNPSCLSVLNQQWKYNTLAKELSTYLDSNCLDYNAADNGNLYMHSCTGESNQEFKVPEDWFPNTEPTISIGVLHQVRVVFDMTKCMDSGYGGPDEGNIYMSSCASSIGNGNQYFTYDASTKQIKQNTIYGIRCLDYAGGDTKNVYMGICNSDGLNQMWRYKSSDKTLRTFQDDNCLDLDTAGGVDNLYLHECNGGTNQQFIIPFQWEKVMTTTSILNTVMIWSGGTKRCMDGKITDSTYDGAPVAHMNSDCGSITSSKNMDFNWYYDASTREIKNNGKCLDSDDNTLAYSNVVLNDCNGGVYQQWYYEPHTNHLRHLSSSYCLYFQTSTNRLDMASCSSGSEFFVPLTWLQAAYLDKIRVLINGNKCFDARPDSNNNVWMADCQVGNLNQDFTYDSRKLAIKHSGLCLDYDTTAGHGSNVYLADCNYGSSQQWYYDSTDLKLHTRKEGDSKCLDWNDANDDNNLYIHDCLSGDNQRFLVPSLWLPMIEDTQQQGTPNEFQIGGYSTRLIPTGVWNGQWNDQIGDKCIVDSMKDMLETCDDSMAFLLGDLTSVGTLRAIAQEIKENGPGYMPGTCCLDDAANGDWFGFNYNVGVSFFENPMECMNPGPWHLGISKEACKSAGGRYFRSPCYTLMDCINNRPSPGEQGYSESFENFASGIVITDPLDDKQCGNARTNLGFEEDYAYDVDVCHAFFEQECDDFYASVDGLVGDLGYGDTTTKNFQTDTWDSPLPFTPLPNPGWAFTTVPPDDGTSAQLGKMQYAWNSANMAKEMADLQYEFIENDPGCNDLFSKEKTVAGSSVPNPAYWVCMGVSATKSTLQKAAVVVITLAAQSLDFAYDIMTISPGRELEIYYLTKSIYDNLETFQPWVNTGLQTINKNIDKQHNAMRDELIDYICATVQGMGGTCVSRRRLESSDAENNERDLLEMSGSPQIEFPDGTMADRLQAVFEELGDVNTIITAVKNFMNRIEHVLDRIDIVDNSTEVDPTTPVVLGPGVVPESKKEKAKKKAKAEKSKKNSIFSEGDDARKLLGFEDVDVEDVGTVGTKLDALEEKVDVMVGEVVTVKAKVDSLEDKVDALSSMMAQLIDQNQKLLQGKVTLDYQE